MKLLCLNIWGGIIFEPLLDYLKDMSENIDIFCFQEVFSTGSEHINIVEDRYRSDIYSDIEKALSNHKGYYAADIVGLDFLKKVDFPLTFGLAVFVRNSLVVKKDRDFIVVEGEDTDKLNDKIPRNMQYVEVDDGHEKFNIFNIHGLWVPDGKNDNPKRIKQSEKILEIMNEFSGKKILCGDFNLNPDTKSIKLLENSFRNLIKEYNVSTTRSKLCSIPEKFADYVFVSEDVNVNEFSVPNIPVSDHLPMILDFN